jgi:AcrR family transcriptional regulator
MNDSISTPEALLEAANRLFAERGFDGSSVRDITAEAGANLGAVTYHFGSKDALHHAVLERALVPFRTKLAETAAAPGHPLDRIEAVLRAVFQHLADHPDIPRLIVQQLAAGTELPTVVRTTMQANIGLMAQLIREGQQHGSITSGDPQLLALSVGSQPIFLALVRHALRQAVSLDPADPATRQALADSVVRFVRRGLQAEKEVSP